MELNLNPNKQYKPVNDCLGTCKTPTGCTCGRKKQTVIVNGLTVKACGCGKNPGGACGGALKKAEAEAAAGSSSELAAPAASTGGSCCSSGGGGCSSGGCSSGGCSSGGCSSGGGCCGSSSKGTHKLEVFDWLYDMPESQLETQMVEVQFKNTRKGYYLNSNNLDLYKGDIVAVEATPGHDIGEVTLTGKLVLLQMKKSNNRGQQGEQKRIYRIAKPLDIEKFNEAKALEHKTMLRARELAESLNLNMKISDVEYQGDGNKAIFYYIADERVDFRQLIKVYAEQFRVKIEMKQIGARQEAGRVGGIGPCGRELCCSSSMSNFVSVSTSAARFQDISLNPQKLAGQCGKLKCCLNYEVDTYVEAQKKLPSREIVLDTKDGAFFHFKTDILSGMMTYSTDKHFAANLVTVNKDRVYEVIKMNRNGNKPVRIDIENVEVQEKTGAMDILEDNINRFDNNANNKNRKKKVVKGGGRPQAEAAQATEREPKDVAVVNPENRESNPNQQRSKSRNNNNRFKNRSRNNENRNNNRNDNSPQNEA